MKKNLRSQVTQYEHVCCSINTCVHGGDYFLFLYPICTDSQYVPSLTCRLAVSELDSPSASNTVSLKMYFPATKLTSCNTAP